jgi:hypothetical protein
MKEKETLEEVAKRLYEYKSQNPPYTIITPKAKIEGFIEGANWQAERMYSEEDLKEAFYQGWVLSGAEVSFRDAINKWFEQHKKK